MKDEDNRNVLYLVGGGLTCATARRCGRVAEEFRLSNICYKVLESVANELRVEEENTETEEDLVNHFFQRCEIKSPNLEELIEHLSLSGSPVYDRLAQRLGAHFFYILRDKLVELGPEKPENIAQLILELHKESARVGSWKGFLTTNYDTLLEDAYADVGCTADLGFRYEGSVSSDWVMPLLKLHGSIDWMDSIPISKSIPESAESVSWIGPRRTKRATDYPFNMIWGRAREVMASADTIRIIGASLRAADWHVIHLLFQWALIELGAPTNREIELINSVDACDLLISDYPELPLTPIYKIPAVRQFALDREYGGVEDDSQYEKENDEIVKCQICRSGSAAEFWLQAVIEDDIEVVEKSEAIASFKSNAA